MTKFTPKPKARLDRGKPPWCNLLKAERKLPKETSLRLWPKRSSLHPEREVSRWLPGILQAVVVLVVEMDRVWPHQLARCIRNRLQVEWPGWDEDPRTMKDVYVFFRWIQHGKAAWLAFLWSFLAFPLSWRWAFCFWGARQYRKSGSFSTSVTSI